MVAPASPAPPHASTALAVSMQQLVCGYSGVPVVQAVSLEVDASLLDVLD